MSLLEETEAELARESAARVQAEAEVARLRARVRDLESDLAWIQHQAPARSEGASA